MSALDQDPPDDDFDALAGEYALGLLDGPAAARAAALRRRDARFDAAVRAWQARLMPLAMAAEAVEPPPAVWSRIAAGIGKSAPAPARAGVRRWLLDWRPFGVGALCGAVAAAVLFLALPGRAPEPSPAAVATLASSTGGVFLATAEAAGQGTRLIIDPLNVTVPAGKSAELWLIVPAAKPYPLGLLASGHAVVVEDATIPKADQLGDVSLAVSLEPPGGAPHGVATGPVIALAKFSEL
jgi:anti-sigma-K factor RskA